MNQEFNLTKEIHVCVELVYPYILWLKKYPRESVELNLYSLVFHRVLSFLLLLNFLLTISKICFVSFLSFFLSELVHLLGMGKAPLESYICLVQFSCLKAFPKFLVLYLTSHDTQDQQSGMVKTDGKSFESVWGDLKTRAERLPLVPRDLA